MRFLATAFGTVLAAGALLAAGVQESRADETRAAAAVRVAPAPDGTDAPKPGTEEEERNYARREAESPQVQEFSGGFVIALLTIVVLVLLIVLLAKSI